VSEEDANRERKEESRSAKRRARELERENLASVSSNANFFGYS